MFKISAGEGEGKVQKKEENTNQWPRQQFLVPHRNNGRGYTATLFRRGLHSDYTVCSCLEGEKLF